jgi:hypothetical protein
LVVAAGQLPLPVQLVVLVGVLPVQLWARQPMLVSQKSHLPAPSQVPFRPQLLWALARQRALGSAPPSGTGEQVPTLPVTLQLWHVPVVASVQAVLQQTPSVQNPLRHWSALEQLAPFDFLPHDPFTHTLPAAQWASVVQLLRQLPVAVSHT